MNASLLVQDHAYDIKFRCWSNAPNSSEEFQQRNQLSHCHTPCNQYTTYPDETVEPIPSALGIAPSQDGSSKSFDFEGTFTGNPSFEASPDRRHVSNGTKSWKRPAGGGSYHGSCHVRVLPNTGAQGKLQLTFTPPRRRGDRCELQRIRRPMPGRYEWIGLPDACVHRGTQWIRCSD
jgi:hypothetical protein